MANVQLNEVHLSFPFGISEYGQIPRFNVRSRTMEIVGQDDRIYAGMDELVNALLEKRPRTRNAETLCKKSLHIVVPPSNDVAAFSIPWYAPAGNSRVCDIFMFTDDHLTVFFPDTVRTVYRPILYTNPMIAVDEMPSPWGPMDDDDLPPLEDELTLDTFPTAEIGMVDPGGINLDGHFLHLIADLIEERNNATADHPVVRKCSICLETETDLKKDTIGLLMAECQTEGHDTCIECFRRYITSTVNNPISVNTPYVCCPSEGCTAPIDDHLLASILTNDELGMVNTRITQCRARACVTMTCPHAECNLEVRVNATNLQDRAVGTLPLMCGNNHYFCFHCLARVRERDYMRFCAAESINQIVAVCSCSVDTRPRIGSFNRYFTRPRKDGELSLMRNFELNIDECVRQIEKFCTGDTMSVACMCCRAPLHRATACNELSHCGQVRCWVCGKAGLDYDTRLIDHWNAEGRRACCPRWGTSDHFWDLTVHARERCREGVCHDDGHDCNQGAHREFKKQVTGVRRLRRLQRTITSMCQPFQNHVVRKIYDNKGAAMEWLDRLRLACEHDAII